MIISLCWRQNRVSLRPPSKAHQGNKQGGNEEVRPHVVIVVNNRHRSTQINITKVCLSHFFYHTQKQSTFLNLPSILFLFHYVFSVPNGSRCNTISLSAFKTMGRTLSLQYILCVWVYYSTLEIKLYSLFPFPL